MQNLRHPAPRRTCERWGAADAAQCVTDVVRAGCPGGRVAWACECFFFFQAEDGIRDATVTGVQTCALPIEGYGIRDATVTGVQTCALPICGPPYDGEAGDQGQQGA